MPGKIGRSGSLLLSLRRSAWLVVAVAVVPFVWACSSDEEDDRPEGYDEVVAWLDEQSADLTEGDTPAISGEAATCTADRLVERLPPPVFASLPAWTPVTPLGIGDAWAAASSPFPADSTGEPKDPNLVFEFPELAWELPGAFGRCIGPVDHPQRNELRDQFEAEITTGYMRSVSDEGGYTAETATCMADLFLVVDQDNATRFLDVGVTESDPWTLSFLATSCSDLDVVGETASR